MDRIEAIALTVAGAFISLVIVIVLVAPKLGGKPAGEVDNSKGGGRWGGYEG